LSSPAGSEGLGRDAQPARRTRHAGDVAVRDDPDATPSGSSCPRVGRDERSAAGAQRNTEPDRRARQGLQPAARIDRDHPPAEAIARCRETATLPASSIATHSVTEGQDTACICASLTLTRFHVGESRPSRSVELRTAPFASTATHNRADGHDTPSSVVDAANGADGSIARARDHTNREWARAAGASPRAPESPIIKTTIQPRALPLPIRTGAGNDANACSDGAHSDRTRHRARDRCDRHTTSWLLLRISTIRGPDRIRPAG
jgi:hypothetical protein